MDAFTESGHLTYPIQEGMRLILITVASHVAITVASHRMLALHIYFIEDRFEFELHRQSVPDPYIVSR